MAWTSEGVAFPNPNGPKPEEQEIWYVEPAGKNPSGSVTFLKMVKKAEHGVVITSTPENEKQLDWAKRVAGEPITTHIITKANKVEENPLSDSPKIVKVISLWDHKGLKDRIAAGKQSKKQPESLSPAAA